MAQKALLDTAKAERKPPFSYLLFDETEVACLAAGVVTDRMRGQAQDALRRIFGSLGDEAVARTLEVLGVTKGN